MGSMVTACTLAEVHLLESSSAVTKILALGTVAVEAFSTAVTGSSVGHAFRIRERLEQAVNEHGYDDRVFEPTTRLWCTRQAARVACEQTGCLEQYEELCDEQAESAMFTNIPHI